jgi:hypothetical protein
MPTNKKRGVLQSRTSAGAVWLRPTPTTCTFPGAIP